MHARPAGPKHLRRFRTHTPPLLRLANLAQQHLHSVVYKPVGRLGHPHHTNADRRRQREAKFLVPHHLHRQDRVLFERVKHPNSHAIRIQIEHHALPPLARRVRQPDEAGAAHFGARRHPPPAIHAAQVGTDHHVLAIKPAVMRKVRNLLWHAHYFQLLQP